jgi:light-regulated signal transduction histidine kinase (bacteriophytochrome)
MDHFVDNFASTPVDQADREFEQFICAACHNLRESLREIRLRTEDAPGCGIEDQIRAMESLLDGMVEYSAVWVVKNEPSRVEMKSVLSLVLVHLEKQMQESGAVVTHDALPAVMGDFRQLGAILRHLIENALKFRGEAAPVIHLSAHRDGMKWVLGVHDNGPGIESTYRERVFFPFKRLHGRDCAGNGLGLAICKKLVERHDGKIWVESEPGGGTTVLFTLTAAN